MSRTFFQDFSKDDGQPVTVEYSVDGSYTPTTYSPMYGADGGDCPEFCIVSSWPNSEEYNELFSRRKAIEDSWHGKSIMWLIGFSSSDTADELQEINDRLAVLEERAELTDAERDRMLDWVAEHYVEDYSDEIDF